MQILTATYQAISSTKKEGSETVYNIEVKELHDFLVGESGVVVHNNCIKQIANAADEVKLRNKIKSTSGVGDDIVEEIVEEIADEGAEPSYKERTQTYLSRAKSTLEERK